VRLLGRLGEGGMGVVFLGEEDDGRRVAVKVIRADYARDHQFRARFAAEAAAARRVARFCTAPVLDAGAITPNAVTIISPRWTYMICSFLANSDKGIL